MSHPLATLDGMLDLIDSLEKTGQISPRFRDAMKGLTRTPEGEQIKRDDLDTFNVSDEPGSDE